MSDTRATIAIVGGTGKTGRWVLKDALQRGHPVRLLARSPAKAEAVLSELFPEKPKEALLEVVTVIKGSVSDEGTMTQLLEGAQYLVSTLGMTNPPEWAVRPGVEAIIKAMRAVEKPPKFISMSSIGLGDSLQQAKQAWSRILTWLSLNIMLKQVFLDMQAAEDYILANREGLNITIARASILADADPDKTPGYKLVHVNDAKAKLSFTVDRHQVGAALLDLCQPGKHDNGEISIFRP